MTASIGVATFPVDGATADEVLLAADRACFVAKRGGRDRVATAAEGRALAAEFSPAGADAGRLRGHGRPAEARMPRHPDRHAAVTMAR